VCHERNQQEEKVIAGFYAYIVADASNSTGKPIDGIFSIEWDRPGAIPDWSIEPSHDGVHDGVCTWGIQVPVFPDPLQREVRFRTYSTASGEITFWGTFIPEDPLMETIIISRTYEIVP